MPDPIPNHIYTGDCLETMRSWPDACVDHCIADPPFGIASGRGRRGKRGLGWAFSSHVTMEEAWDQFSEDEYFRFSLDWLREVCRVVKPNGNILVFGTFHNIYLLGFLLGHVLDRRILNSIVWFKPNAQPNITARMLTESTEQIVWAVNETPAKAKGWTFNYPIAKQLAEDKQMRNYWEAGVSPPRNLVAEPVVSGSQRQHPSQKPLRLVDRLIRLATEPKNLILDPFAGSGVTALSALRYRRRYVLIESDPRYVRKAKLAIGRFPSSSRGRLVQKDGPLAHLTDEDLDSLTEAPVPQADDLNLVFQIPRIVKRGATTRAKIAQVLHYVPRQGPYYADAAIALQLISRADSRNGTGQTLELSALGKRWLDGPTSLRKQLRKEIVLAAPISKFLIAQLGLTGKAALNSELLYDEARIAKILEDLDLSKNTAQRRAKTLSTWFQAIRDDARPRKKMRH